MHIPDGYLSPSTCAALYAAATPFWTIAVRRVQRLLLTRFVPLISLLAAFSFVVMMFNLPLPGGTTGHAVCVAVAAIIVGPWGSMLAISVALLIQALLFGDGGITAFGANCFNLAVVGSLVAYVVYRVIAGRSEVSSSRRVVAASIAGYAAINASAFCAAIEFGIQPMLFHDATGAPLYAPYPLRIAVPAMMIGHLTVAGIAELILSGGVVAWLQRSEPSLLSLTAPGAREADGGRTQSAWLLTRPLWIAVATLMIIAPLGLVAAGTAWGEWNARDFADPEARGRIAAASGNVSPPLHPPAGLERLSGAWTAPMSGYAPRFMQSAAFGYVLSAMFGVGLIMLAVLLIGWTTARLRHDSTSTRESAR